MIKRFPSRNSRSKGIKVKHVLQICLLLGVCFWLIYQVKHSHDKKNEFDGKDAKVSTTTRTHVHDNEILKLGRKDLHPRVDDVAKNEKAAEDEDEETVPEEEIINGVGDNKHAEELEQELELTKHEEEEREDVSKHEQEEERGDDDDDDENNKGDMEEEKKAEETEVESRAAGDDELDEHDQDKLDGESVEEDLLDEEKEKGREDDDAKEGEVNKEEDKEVHATLPEDEDHEDGSQNSHEAREENYKGDDASSAVTHDENTGGKDKINDLQQEQGDMAANNSRQEDEVANSSGTGIADDIIKTDSTLQQEQGDMAANNSRQEDEVANSNGTGIANDIIKTDSTLQQEQGDMAANNSRQEDEVANSSGTGIANEIVKTGSILQQEQGDKAANNSASVLSGGEQTIKDERIINLPSSENQSTTNVLAVGNVKTGNKNTTGDTASLAAAVSDSTSEENATSGGLAIGGLSNRDSTEAEKINYDETVSGNALSSNSNSNLESGVDQAVSKDETTGEAEGVKPGLPITHSGVSHGGTSEENKTESRHNGNRGIEGGVRHDPIDSSDSSVGQEENSGFGTNVGVGNQTVAAE
ncbi:unnamed protein product [Linum trigynum]|uniref:Uncharacterized protein n=1 Tax=Linum trigynum TaxID=586398 RepID=A0AAV2EW16_9ROSI